MLAHGGFVPQARPAVAVAADGSLGAVQEPSRVGIIELSGGVAFAEIGIDAQAEGTEIAWVGTQPRLLVVSRFAKQSTVHLLDPHGPRTVAEIRMESAVHLFATVGTHALVVGAVGAIVLATSDTAITPYQFPTRMSPRAAGASVGLFTVAVGGAIEEWDPQARMPRRRFRTPHAATINALGGSDRVVWMTTQHDPNRIEVIPLVNRGQPKSHELPEAIAAVSGHPRSDLLVCVGASGTLYLIDLDGRTPLRTIAAPGIDRVDAASLIVARHTALLVAQAGRPLQIVSVDGRESVPEILVPVSVARVPAPMTTFRSSLSAEVDTEVETGVDKEPPRLPVAPVVGAPPALPPPPPPPKSVRAPASTFDAAPTEVKLSVSERMSGWRTRGKPPPAVGQALTAAHEVAPESDHIGAWRDAVVAWTRAAAHGSAPPPPAVELDALIARFGLQPRHAPALVLAYGAHLLGERGAAPADIARVLGGGWADALGTGELAERGVLRHAKSRVQLAEPIQRALDGLPALGGALVGTPGPIAVLGPCAIIGDGDLHALAESLIPRAATAILVAHPGAEPSALLLEARARGAVPLVRAAAIDLARFADEPVIVVVADAHAAEQLGIPVL